MCHQKRYRATFILQGNFHKTPIKLYKTLTSKNTHFTHPRCFTMIREISYRATYRAATGQLLIYRATFNWPPMFYYKTWKSRFSQTIVFLRVNFKISQIYRATFEKISANTKLFFWKLQNWNWNECVFVIFENVAIFHSLTPDVSLCPIA